MGIVIVWCHYPFPQKFHFEYGSNQLQYMYSLQKRRNPVRDELIPRRVQQQQKSSQILYHSPTYFSPHSIEKSYKQHPHLILSPNESRQDLTKTVHRAPLRSTLSVTVFDQKYNELNRRIKDILNEQTRSSQKKGFKYSLVDTKEIDRAAKDHDYRTAKDNDYRVTKENDYRVTKENDFRITRENDSRITREYDSRITRDNDFRTESRLKNKVASQASNYYIQCLNRKTSVVTEFYTHIHTTILTFKEFLKAASMARARQPDSRIPSQISGRKTIIFDMDETLIHTSEQMTPLYEIQVPFKYVRGKMIWGYVSVRPYAKEIIKKLSRFFDIIVFTAGSQPYADPILNHIDPTNCIKHRLYRQSCTQVANQVFVKDLRILGRNLDNVVLVDNAPYSYMMQLENGIPILNFFRGKTDNQLMMLEPYLMSLLEVSDVRLKNRQHFCLREYMNFHSHEQLIHSLYKKLL